MAHTDKRHTVPVGSPIRACCQGWLARRAFLLRASNSSQISRRVSRWFRIPRSWLRVDNDARKRNI